MTNKYIFTIGVVVLLIIAMGAYTIRHRTESPKQATESPSSEKLQIVASFYPMEFFAEQIAGSYADITNVTPAGTEPHDFEPSAQDIAKMERANLIILNGNLEPWGANIQANLQHSPVRIIVAGEGIIKNADPHIWLDPILAKEIVRKIGDAIVAIDPSNSEFYHANTNDLLQKLDQLDTDYKTRLAHCASQDFVTSHAAFGYLAEQYALHQVPIAGLSPEEEPSPQTLATVAKFVQQNNVKYIFFESLVSPKLAQTIASETHTQTLELNPIEGLTTEEKQEGKSYFSVMRSNLQNLQTALSCRI
ncbi:MAG: zinc ABC transporter substrate-binding protein [Patescibacteria group bacterium]